MIRSPRYMPGQPWLHAASLSTSSETDDLHVVAIVAAHESPDSNLASKIIQTRPVHVLQAIRMRTFDQFSTMKGARNASLTSFDDAFFVQIEVNFSIDNLDACKLSDHVVDVVLVTAR